jgi:hypothetical protein
MSLLLHYYWTKERVSTKTFKFLTKIKVEIIIPIKKINALKLFSQKFIKFQQLVYQKKSYEDKTLAKSLF